MADDTVYFWECLGEPAILGFSTDPNYLEFRTPNWRAEGEYRGSPMLPGISRERIAHAASGGHVIVIRSRDGSSADMRPAGEWPPEVAPA